MRLRIDFGINGARREATWWQPIEMFPHAILFNGTRYEWFMYDEDPSKTYDKILTFVEMSLGDGRWYNCKDFDHEFGYASRTACECGSAYTSFSWDHMRFCPLWEKWS